MYTNSEGALGLGIGWVYLSDRPGPRPKFKPPARPRPKFAQNQPGFYITFFLKIYIIIHHYTKKSGFLSYESYHFSNFPNTYLKNFNHRQDNNFFLIFK